MSNGKLVKPLSSDNKMPANAITRPLSELSVVDVGTLLDRLDIGEFKDLFVRNKIDVTSAGDTSDGGGGLGHDDDAMNIMSGLDDAMNMEESGVEISSRSQQLSELPMNEVGRLLESNEYDEYKAVFVKELGRSLTVKELGIYGMQHSSL
jgi:hypothetical protein